MGMEEGGDDGVIIMGPILRPAFFSLVDIHHFGWGAGNEEGGRLLVYGSSQW